MGGGSWFVTPEEGGFFKRSHDKVNRIELLICYIFSQLSISSTKNNWKKDFFQTFFPFKYYYTYFSSELTIFNFTRFVDGALLKFLWKFYRQMRCKKKKLKNRATLCRLYFFNINFYFLLSTFLYSQLARYYNGPFH